MVACGRAFLFCCFFIVFLSCSVQQRRYRPGLGVNWHHRSGALGDLHKTRHAEKENPDRMATIGTSGATLTLIPSAETVVPIHSRVKSIPPADSCDVLVFRDGSEVSARVLSCSDGKVRFYRCDLENGPEYVLSTARLSMIKYANGERKGFERQEKKYTPAEIPSETATVPEAPRPNSQATSALTLSILGILTTVLGIGLLFALVSLPFGLAALNDEKKSPGKYNNINMARVAIALDIFVITLYLLIIGFIIYYLMYL